MLVNLETLNLKWTPMLELLVEIKNMKKLRSPIFQQVDCEGPYHNSVKIQEGFRALTELQSLLKVYINSKALKELRMLTQLKKLSVNLTYGDVKDFFGIVKNIENLERLSVRLLTSEEEIVDLETMGSPPLCVERLDLAMYIKKVPIWICKHENLIRLELALVGSTNDSMRVLQALPNLLVFLLHVRECDEYLHLKEGWFPKLQYLELKNFIELKYMMIEKGAMPSLTKLHIGPGPLLKEIPTGIEHLKNLKELVFRMMLKVVYCMIKHDNWENLTNHIPQIYATYQDTLPEFKCFKSTQLSSLLAKDFEELLKDIEYEYY